MGHLCHEFDRMRGQLEENNRQLWLIIEEERALRSAIAHDIRSPLSVLKGYQEMLIDYVPDGTIDKEKSVEMLLDPILGVILNKVDMSKQGHYGHYYGKYGKYYGKYGKENEKTQ